MRDVLHSVRRVATLLSLLVFVVTSVLWVRSYFANDSVNFEFGNTTFNGLASHNGLIWVEIGYDDDVPIPHLFVLVLSVPLLLWWILERTNERAYSRPKIPLLYLRLRPSRHARPLPGMRHGSSRVGEERCSRAKPGWQGRVGVGGSTEPGTLASLPRGVIVGSAAAR